MTRQTRRKIIESIIKTWRQYKLLIIVGAVAVATGITGICIHVHNSHKEDIPTADVDAYSDIFDTDTPNVERPKTITTTLADGTVVEEDDPTVLAYNKDTRPGYMNNCYFLGDSRTVAMVSYGFISDENALAKVGIAHTSVESTTFMQNSGKQYTLQQYLKAIDAPVIYICYGVNGMNGLSEDKYEKTYTSLVEHIIEMAPNSKIVLMSIWPVDDNGTYRGSVKNEWIEKYNKFLLALAEHEGIYYLDVASELKGDNGQIKREYDSGDGLHYKASAYNVILDYIIHHPVKGISDEGDFVVHYVKPRGEFKTIMTEKAPLPTNVVSPMPTLEPSPSPIAEAQPTIYVTPSPSPIAVPTKPVITPTPIPTPTAEPTSQPPETEPAPGPTPEPSSEQPPEPTTQQPPETEPPETPEPSTE